MGGSYGTFTMTNDNSDSFDVVNPDPGAMIESLRAFGYNIGTSIADIIDNSIFGGAKNIDLKFLWEGDKSVIAIIDDGLGMSETELINAMRPGSNNPLEKRETSDLGRFGLGLKTASFSQCRKLTTATKRKGGEIAIRSWDLDYVNLSGEWRLKKVNADYFPNTLYRLKEMDSGTIVLWENIDRLVKGAAKDDVRREKIFYEHIDSVKEHLSMVFHRYLEKKGFLNINVNGHKIESWDPFLRKNDSTQRLPEESLYHNNQKIIVKPYILPHRSKLNDRTYEKAGGPSGWNARQGFYIYRNNRLIVAGDWLGLGFKKEMNTKLARIAVEIPNTMDDDWKIDVKKSVARPPADLRADFKRIGRLTIERAAEVYNHRGKTVERQNAQDFVFPWNKNVHNGTYYYSINRKHPIIADVVKNAGGQEQKITAMLSLIEETVPVHLILLDNTTNPDSVYTSFGNKPTEEMMEVMMEILKSMTDSGFSVSDAKKRMLLMEPFCEYQEYVCDLFDEYEGGKL